MRRYARVVIKMIVEDRDMPRVTEARIKGRIERFLIRDQLLQVGEVDVQAKVRGPIEVNSKGYAVPYK